MQTARRTRFFKNLIILISLVGFCAGCAVYDRKRGVFVSSSVQDVSLEKSAKDPITLVLLPFGAPKEAIVGRVTNENFVSGIYVVANFTYVFDDVDQGNLRTSLVDSLNKSGLVRMHDAKSVDEARKVSGHKVHIKFD